MAERFIIDGNFTQSFVGTVALQAQACPPGVDLNNKASLYYDVATGEAAATNLITDISNAPYTNPTYSYINEPGRQWIRKYTLALAKEMLGSVRGKYQALPIPGSETTLDYTRLLSEALAEKEALITTLREDLAGVTTQGQLERTTTENELRQTGLQAQGRYQIYIH